MSVTNRQVLSKVAGIIESLTRISHGFYQTATPWLKSEVEG